MVKESPSTAAQISFLCLDGPSFKATTLLKLTAASGREDRGSLVRRCGGDKSMVDQGNIVIPELAQVVTRETVEFVVG